MKKLMLTMVMTAFSVLGMSQIEYGKWEIVEVTDEFGDPTGDSVTRSYFEGTFSNSATSGSGLTVSVIDYGEAIMLKLYEYNSPPAASMSYDDCFGNISVKRESGDIETYRAFALSSGGLYFNNEDEFMSLFRNNSGETLKFVVQESSFSDYGSSRYIFSVTLP